jgi:hypothetical protein
MYPGDARAKWPAALLTDPRVTHYWDEQRVIGTTYLSHLPAILDRRADGTLPPTADALWDAFFLYARGDGWSERAPVPIVWGYPIMVTRDRLARELDALLRR